MAKKKLSDQASPIYPNRIALDIELLSSEEYPGSAYMVFDFDLQKVFGKKGRVPVIFTVGEHSFRTSIAVYAGVPMMVFNASMRAATGYKAGDIIHAVLERDFSLRTVEIPEDVRIPLTDAGVWDIFADYSYTHKKEVMKWLNDAKKPETRARRIAKLSDKLNHDNEA